MKKLRRSGHRQRLFIGLAWVTIATLIGGYLLAGMISTSSECNFNPAMNDRGETEF